MANLYNRPRPEVLQFDRTAENLQKTAETVTKRFGVGTRFFDKDTVPRINADCPWTPAPECDVSNVYRTIDGSCNNLKKPNYGRAATPYQRLKDAEYTQGSLAFPRIGKILVYKTTARWLCQLIGFDCDLLPSASGDRRSKSKQTMITPPSGELTKLMANFVFS